VSHDDVGKIIWYENALEEVYEVIDKMHTYITTREGNLSDLISHAEYVMNVLESVLPEEE